MGLSLKLLGEFAVRDENGKALSLPTRKTRGLLAYLAVNADKPQQRERLMTLLWGDRGEQQARHSLNQALMSIRRLGNAAGISLLEGDGERVMLLGDAVTIDIADFHSRLSKDPAGAAALYKGALLDGLSIPDPVFEEWLTAVRSELHDCACEALSRAAERSKVDGDTDEAVSFLKRLVALDPLREDAHRQLMKLLHKSGDRAGALRQYQACAEILKQELQVEPDAETQALVANIKGNNQTHGPPIIPNSSESLPETLPPLPQIPSVAILPFTNLGDDPEQAYLAEGLRLDIQTMLVRIPGLFLISTRPVDAAIKRELAPEQLSRELGVQYLLQGATQRANGKIRITVQLTDATAERVIWAEHYDRIPENILTVQDEITAEVLAALDRKLVTGQLSRYRSTLRSLEAREQFYRGLSHFYANTKSDNDAARQYFERVAELEPSSPAGPTYLSIIFWRDAFDFSPERRSDSLKKALGWAEKGFQFGNSNGLAHIVLASNHLLNRRHQQALSTSYKAFDLRPNCPAANASLAKILLYCGDYEEAIKTIKVAMRISLTYPPWFANVLAAAYREKGDLGNAILAARQTTERDPDDIEAKIMLCSGLIAADDRKEAQQVADQILLLQPDFSVRRYSEDQPFKDQSVLVRFSDSLLKAGLPE